MKIIDSVIDSNQTSAFHLANERHRFPPIEVCQSHSTNKHSYWRSRPHWCMPQSCKSSSKCSMPISCIDSTLQWFSRIPKSAMIMAMPLVDFPHLTRSRSGLDSRQVQSSRGCYRRGAGQIGTSENMLERVRTARWRSEQL